jgi:aminoglycoside 6'-N-acetyltransferase
MHDVSFRPLDVEDLPQLTGWLGEEHVQRWWKDPSAPDDVEAKYLPRIRGEEPTEVFIILWRGRGAGMIQRYRIGDYPSWSAAIASSTLTFDAAAGIDYLIGEPDLIGQGIGSAAIEEFSATVFDRYPDVDTILVTPQEANRASCRVLEKAGYRVAWTGMLDSDDPADAGPAVLYVLSRNA